MRATCWLILALSSVVPNGVGAEATPPSPESLERLVHALEAQWGRCGDTLWIPDPAAAEALVEAGAAAVPILIRELQDPKSLSRVAAADVLGRIQPAAPETIEALLGALVQPPPGHRRLAVTAQEALIRIGAPAVPRLIQTLVEGSAEARSAAARIFHSMGDAALPAVPALEDALDAESPWLRMEAADALLRIVPDHPRALEALIAAIPEDPALRASALYRLANAPPAHRARAVAFFSEEVGHPSPRVREVAVALLGSFGEDAKGALPLVVERVQRDDEGSVVTLAAEAARKMEPGSDVVFLSVLARLGTSDLDVREGGYQALESILRVESEHGVRERALPHLLRGLEDASSEIQRASRMSLRSYSGTDAAPAIAGVLLRLLSEGNPRGVRAEEVLQLDPENQELAPLLLGWLGSPDSARRTLAAQAFGELLAAERREAEPARRNGIYARSFDLDAVVAALERLARKSPHTLEGGTALYALKRIRGEEG